eukprot:225204_1
MTQPQLPEDIHFHLFSGQSQNSSAYNKGIIPYMNLDTHGYELRSAESFQIRPNETVTTYLNVQIKQFPNKHYATITPNNELYPTKCYQILQTTLIPPEDYTDIKLSIKNTGSTSIFIQRNDLLAFMYIHKVVDLNTIITITNTFQ